MATRCIFLLLLIAFTADAYIDITLDISTSSSDIAYNIPLTVSGTKCPVAVSLSNKQEFISLPKGKKTGKGELKVSSL